ncbi:MAG TPA: alpha-L-fucosidase [Tepidisphaeraceae bacterium]|nr:alpha-L-fucosidase [Tepidisphaeraceae bacterium]
MQHFALAAAAALSLSLFSSIQTARADETTAPSEPMAAGPFQPSWDSLKQYKTPVWFSDAKFGIWAHWTAQCVPEQGDWYARNMYIEGQHDYKYQVEHYGHPSKVGFKDIDNLWHAEHWEPEKLIALYKRAGAQYFVALANHHDNFDCFDSKYQPWNSVNIGPKKDIVGTWEKAARAAGLRFGVTVHAAHAWSWFEVAQGADKTGPLAGVPYDGKLTKADGKGTWWEGYDPQDLYAQNHTPGKKLVWDWQADQGSSVPDKAYCEKFYNRTVDLINKYHPDLLYFDDTVLPLNNVSDVGLRIAAHYYNSNSAQHDGRNEAVMNTKGLNEEQRQCLVWDIERGLADKIEPFAWQTDTCIGSWHYDRSIYDRHRYKTAKTVIQMLADIVSKNGNLLLNIPVRGDGTIDDDELKVVEGIASWMDVNKEAIFGTRPWVTFGEGPSAEPKTPSTQPGKKVPNFNEGKAGFTAKDIRFTTKGDTLYAIAFGWPSDGKLTIKSLAKGSDKYTHDVGAVHLLGADAALQADRSDDGLNITLPAEKPAGDTFVFKIDPAAEK